MPQIRDVADGPALRKVTFARQAITSHPTAAKRPVRYLRWSTTRSLSALYQRLSSGWPAKPSHTSYVLPGCVGRRTGDRPTARSSYRGVNEQGFALAFSGPEYAQPVRVVRAPGASALRNNQQLGLASVGRKCGRE